MLQLWLHGQDSLHYNLLDLRPYVLRSPTRTRLSWLVRRLGHRSFQAITHRELMRIVVKVTIPLIETVIRQMHENIVYILLGIFLGGQSHETVFVQEDSHGVDNRSDQNVDTEIVLVLVP